MCLSQHTSDVLHCKQLQTGQNLWKLFTSVGDLITLINICLFFSGKVVLSATMTLQQVLKEIYNIVASHLFIHAVLVVQCEIWTKVVFTYRSCKRKEKTGGSQVNYFSSWIVSSASSLFGDVLWLSHNYEVNAKKLNFKKWIALSTEKNHYLVDSTVCFVKIYPLDSN